MAKIRIPYVDRELTVEIPEGNLIFDEAPREAQAADDFDGAVRSALAQPIGTRPLTGMVKPGQKVIIIADDNTRPTPVQQLIPILLDTLNAAGIPDKDIRIIISSGTHRAMTDAELDAKYGASVLSRVGVLKHKYRDPASLLEYGTTERGIRILVNRHVVEADFRIAVGSIIPHHPSGWSAGAKAVLPGVAGEETVAQMHLLGSRSPGLGVIDTEMRREMEDFAKRINLNFILNVILNRSGELVHAVSGHYIHAHRTGVERSSLIYGVPIEKPADLTISSTSPVDFDFFQGDKGITSAELATRIGGEILLLSGCVEGISPAHPELADYVGRMTNDQLWELVRRGPVPDPLTVAEAIVVNAIRDKLRISVASEGLSPELCAAMGFRHVSPEAVNSYIQSRLHENPDLKIGILRHSAEVVPILKP